MCSYSPVYHVREPGPARNDSPIGRASVAILVGHGDRPWFEARGVDGTPRPIGAIRSVVPGSTDFDAGLLDALLALWPDPFRACPSFETVAAKLQHARHLDFHLGADRIPAEWETLREEARPLYDALTILRVEGDLAAPRRS